MQAEKLLTSKEVQTRTGLSRWTIGRLEDANDFPKKKRITAGRVGWVESEVEAWIQDRAKRDA